ncbi:hypothetical protein MPSEU_000859500 [Mayamaea pseudoterrestris]|nr:hypothetical protein MPSEU_000859500 [Mayamaea pseudoterrestris]
MVLKEWLHPTRRRVMSSSTLRQDAAHASNLGPDESKQPQSTTESPRSLKELLAAIRRNETTELRLGWTDHDFIFNAAFPIRAARALARSLQRNTSITSVCLGHRCLQTSNYFMHRKNYANHPTRLPLVSARKRKQALIVILQAIARSLSQQVTHLQLVLNESLPESVLRHVLTSLPRLLVLELHAVQVNVARNVVVAAASAAVSSSMALTNNATAAIKWDCNIVSQVLVHCKLGHLKSLALIDCGLTDETAVLLADYLHAKGGIANLSVRNNRSIGARGWSRLTQAPIMERLDASLCDMTCVEVQAVAQGIVQRPWPLSALWLNGNYRIDVPGLVAITSPTCCEKIVALDLSYCEIGDYKALKTIMNLQKMTPKARLEQLTMHGSFVSGAEVSNELTLLLKNSSSLRVVRLNDPSTPKVFGVSQLQGLLTSLRDNYDVEELKIDSNGSPDEEHILQEMDFLMRLNRAGRRIFRSQNQHPHQQQRQLLEQRGVPKRRGSNDDDEWFETLERAGQDLDVLFWMVKQSADRFAREQLGLVNNRQRPRKRSTSSLLMMFRGRSDRAVAAMDS